MTKMSPSPSLASAAKRALDVNSGAKAAAINSALKHFRSELLSGKVQPVVSDSSSTAKVRAVLVRKCLLKPFPSPRFLLSASHALTLLQPQEMEKLQQSGAALLSLIPKDANAIFQWAALLTNAAICMTRINVCAQWTGESFLPKYCQHSDNVFIVPANNLFCCCLIRNQYSAYV